MTLKLESYKDEIISLYNSGLSTIKIAEKFNCYQQPVSRLLLKYLNKKSLQPNKGNIRYFETIDSSIKAYMLGFIAADGCVQNFTKSSIGLSITLNIKDRCILDKLREEIGNEHELQILTRNQIRFTLANKYLVQDLEKYGIGPRKSLTMENIIPLIPKEFRKCFILGYFDGDGCIVVRKVPYKNTFHIKQAVQIRGTTPFLRGIVEELEVKSFYISERDSISNLAISSKTEVLRFFELYKECPFYLERKYNKFLTIPN